MRQGRKREIDSYAEVYTCRYRHRGTQAQRPTQRYTWANTSALTHTHLDAQEEHTKSHSCTESQIQRHRHVDRDREIRGSHPCRCTKVLTPKLVRHIPRECTNGHGDPQIYWRNTEARGSTSMHVLHTDRKAMHPHWQSPERLHKHTVAQTHVCIVICMHANRSGYRYYRGIHKPRGTETQQNTQGKFLYTESSNAHSNMSMWTHRCIHPQSHPKTLVLMQTHTHTCAHRHEDGHTDIRIQPEVEEQMYEHQGMHV